MHSPVFCLLKRDGNTFLPGKFVTKFLSVNFIETPKVRFFSFNIFDQSFSKNFSCALKKQLIEID